METQERTVPQIELRGLSKIYQIPGGEVQALSNISLTIERGDIYGIIGMSGAGKSTLIRCINLLETPTTGEVLIDGNCIFRHFPDDPSRGEDLRISGKDLIDLRKEIGMIFQTPNLLMQSTVEKNIAFPMEIAGKSKGEIKDRVSDLLNLVNISDKAKNYPSQLSGGQRQRVSIARALANNPKILLCDEPTSALDTLITNQILDLLWDINRKLNVTIVLITHEIRVVKKICNKVAVIDSNHIVEQGDIGSVMMNPSQEITKQLLIGSKG